jgi:hypothetical protein
MVFGMKVQSVGEEGVLYSGRYISRLRSKTISMNLLFTSVISTKPNILIDYYPSPVFLAVIDCTSSVERQETETTVETDSVSYTSRIINSFVVSVPIFPIKAVTKINFIGIIPSRSLLEPTKQSRLNQQ